MVVTLKNLMNKSKNSQMIKTIINTANLNNLLISAKVFELLAAMVKF